MPPSETLQRIMEFRPMLPANLTVRQIENISYPVVVSPVYEGVRILTLDISDGHRQNIPVVQSLRPLANEQLRAHMEQLPPCLDGIVSFPNSTVSKYRAVENQSLWHGQPGRDWRYYVYDYFFMMKDDRSHNKILMRFENRFKHLCVMPLPSWCTVIDTTPAFSRNDLRSVLKHLNKQGYAKALLRTPHGPYKFGQSSAKENWMMQMNTAYEIPRRP